MIVLSSSCRVALSYGYFKTLGLIVANVFSWHKGIVIMSAMASQISGVSIGYSTVCLGADHRKHQSSVSLAFVRDSPHVGGLCEVFPARRTNNALNVSIWWRHHESQSIVIQVPMEFIFMVSVGNNTSALVIVISGLLPKTSPIY